MNITDPKLFPTIMIVLSLLSAISYGINDISDWRHILYFISGATITFSVVY